MWDRHFYPHFKDGESESREIMGVKSHDKIPNFKVHPFSQSHVASTLKTSTTPLLVLMEHGMRPRLCAKGFTFSRLLAPMASGRQA